MGLAAVLGFTFVGPELKPNRITKDEVKNKSSIELRLPEPLLISEQKDEDLFVSQHSSKPNVTCMALSTYTINNCPFFCFSVKPKNVSR